MKKTLLLTLTSFLIPGILCLGVPVPAHVPENSMAVPSDQVDAPFHGVTGGLGDILDASTDPTEQLPGDWIVTVIGISVGLIGIVVSGTALYIDGHRKIFNARQADGTEGPNTLSHTLSSTFGDGVTTTTSSTIITFVGTYRTWDGEYQKTINAKVTALANKANPQQGKDAAGDDYFARMWAQAQLVGAPAEWVLDDTDTGETINAQNPETGASGVTTISSAYGKLKLRADADDISSIDETEATRYYFP